MHGIDHSASSVIEALALERIAILTPRFWRKVDKSGHGCWLWTGAINGGNARRGHMCAGRRDGREFKILAPRLSWLIHYGAIPYGMLVCHRCDTPLCVRPDHLMLGTPQFNVRDMIHKGRAHWQQPAANDEYDDELLIPRYREAS